MWLISLYFKEFNCSLWRKNDYMEGVLFISQHYVCFYHVPPPAYDNDFSLYYLEKANSKKKKYQRQQRLQRQQQQQQFNQQVKCLPSSAVSKGTESLPSSGLREQHEEAERKAEKKSKLRMVIGIKRVVKVLPVDSRLMLIVTNKRKVQCISPLNIFMMIPNLYLWQWFFSFAAKRDEALATITKMLGGLTLDKRHAIYVFAVASNNANQGAYRRHRRRPTVL